MIILTESYQPQQEGEEVEVRIQIWFALLLVRKLFSIRILQYASHNIINVIITCSSLWNWNHIGSTDPEYTDFIMKKLFSKTKRNRVTSTCASRLKIKTKNKNKKQTKNKKTKKKQKKNPKTKQNKKNTFIKGDIYSVLTFSYRPTSVKGRRKWRWWSRYGPPLHC